MFRSSPFTVTALALATWLCGPLCSSLGAQSTHIVGPGGFAQLDPAIQASSPGDTILITANGRYEHFTLDRGVTIRAAAGVRVLVSNSFFATSRRDTTIRVPAGQQAELVALRFTPELPIMGPRLIGRVLVTGGTVVFRDCWIEGQSSGCGFGFPALDVSNAQIALQLCRVRGHDRGGVALVARRSTVSAFDSTFQGGDGCWDAYAYAADAIQLEASRLHASRVVIAGGSTPFMNPNYDAGHGVLMDARSRMWLAHAIVSGGSGGTAGGRGGDGIRNLSTTPVDAIRLTATGGQGSPPGAPVVGPLVTNPALVVAWASPVGPRLGATWTTRFQLAPRTPIVAVIAWRLAPTTAPAVAEPLWLATNPAPISWATAVSSAQGDASIGLAVPNLPSLRGVRLWAQGAVATGGPIQLTPLLGGQVW